MRVTNFTPLLLVLCLWFDVSSATFDDLMALRYKLHDYLSKNKSLPVDEILKNWPKFDPKKMTPKFPCKVRHRNESRPPSSVHELGPQDIDVIAAMGDSITAAFGAKSTNLINLFLEFRGISWSIGGDEHLETRVTLPNIIKKYNSDLTGYARGFNVAKLPIWTEHLDAAVSGAIADGMLMQASRVIEEMQSSREIDFENDWKLLTIWIGSNDLCGYCDSFHRRHTPQRYSDDLEDALDLLHSKVPRLFVNLVQVIDVTRLHVLDSLYCKVIHYIECDCAIRGQEVRDNVTAAAQDYITQLEHLIGSGRYDTRNDFTVVLQPFFTDTMIPRLPSGDPDLSYFAPDCFHFSQRGQAMAALGLWNNMVQPVGRKQKDWSPDDRFQCLPQDFPYFFTNKNSKIFLEGL